jgi:hypothetical protein
MLNTLARHTPLVNARTLEAIFFLKGVGRRVAHQHRVMEKTEWLRKQI